MRMRCIEHPERFNVYYFDGVSAAGVYAGPLARMRSVTDKLNWREDKDFAEYGDHVKVLTLSEIREQLPGYAMLTVIIEEPLKGGIYQTGNYSDGKWYEVGETCGYW